MKLFDFFRSNERAGGASKRRALQAPPRFVRMHVEWLESRSLLSLAPPYASLIATTNEQPNNYGDSAYISPISAGLYSSPWSEMAGRLSLPTGPAYSLPSTGSDLNFSSPGQSSDGLFYIKPTVSQAEPLLTDNASGYGGIILNSGNNFGGLAQSQGNLSAASGGYYSNNAAGEVQQMLSLLRYVPFSAVPAEQSQRPVIVNAADNFALASDSVTFSASVDTIALASSGLTPPAATDVEAPVSTNVTPPVSTGLSAPASTDISAPPTTVTTAPASTGITAPASSGTSAAGSTSLTAATSTGTTATASTTSESTAQSSALHAAEGGMVTLLRQPIAAHSTVDV